MRNSALASPAGFWPHSQPLPPTPPAPQLALGAALPLGVPLSGSPPSNLALGALAWGERGGEDSEFSRNSWKVIFRAWLVGMLQLQALVLLCSQKGQRCLEESKCESEDRHEQSRLHIGCLGVETVMW